VGPIKEGWPAGVVFALGGGPPIEVELPIRWSFLDGIAGARGYDSLSVEGAAAIGVGEFACGEVRVTITDHWSVEETVRLRRHVQANPGREAINLALEASIEIDDLRPFAPGMIYSPTQWRRGETFLFADHRLAYPIAAVWSRAIARLFWLARTRPGERDERAERTRGASRYRQRTQLGSVGFRIDDHGRLIARWPYAEEDKSAMLDASGTPAVAFYPMENGLDFVLEYELGLRPAAEFCEATRLVVERIVSLVEPKPSNADLNLLDAIDWRLDSAAKTFRATPEGFSGFILTFDPERGYDSEAKAFGASFAEHAMSDSRSILEYGFTGRQLNIAYCLAKRDLEGWRGRASAVIDSFVKRMATPSGWVYTLFDTSADEPLYACGDPRGVVMHYLGASAVSGTYTRMMAEAGADLLLSAELPELAGDRAADWLGVCQRLAGFFVRVQNSDGSWFRAYAPDGTPIVGGDWFGEPREAARTATSAVIPYLLAVAAHGDPDGKFREAALRGGRYVLKHQVARAEFRGGTLDNPNLVDKEAAFLVMRALFALSRHDEDAAWLSGAIAAAWTAVSWHSFWPVPTLAGTPVGAAKVRSVGWGGINSVWGVGVTDIYSLFFAGDLTRLGAVAKLRLFGRIAELIAGSSLELLSRPGKLYGFADTGMQPEGISFCSQGADDSLISQGDIWGGLAWPYTAGTFGLGDFLSARMEVAA
jgi:hypothetical protein